MQEVSMLKQIHCASKGLKSGSVELLGHYYVPAGSSLDFKQQLAGILGNTLHNYTF
jgi:hypothetical protein